MTTAAVSASLAVLVAGVCATWHLTDGLLAFTTEGARRLSVERSPKAIPIVAWRDARPTIGHLGEPGPVRIVDFIYTRCPTVCQSLGGVFGLLQRELAVELAQGSVEMWSVSFDIEHDSPEALRAWGQRYGAGGGWHAAAPATSSDLKQLKRAFGVHVRPDDMGGFVHNAALSIVDRQGRLVAVIDVDAWQSAAAKARRLATDEHGS